MQSYKQSFKRQDTQNLDLSVFNCGLQRCEAGYTWGPGVRDHYLIHLVISGRGSYSLEETNYNICEGDLFFARPSRLITYTADQKEPWEYYWVGFNGTAAGRLAQQLPFSEETPVFHSENPVESRKLLHDIYESTGPKPADEARMTGSLYLFIAHLIAQKSEDISDRPDTSTGYVIDAVKFIQFNYSHNIGVDDIAKAVGISRSHLYRVFLKHTGKSPIDYLTEFRIGEACVLLETTSLSIAEVAYSTGFYDQFYFSRVFKKVKGVAPSRYLQQLRQTDARSS